MRAHYENVPASSEWRLCDPMFLMSDFGGDPWVPLASAEVGTRGDTYSKMRQTYVSFWCIGLSTRKMHVGLRLQTYIHL